MSAEMKAGVDAAEVSCVPADIFRSELFAAAAAKVSDLLKLCCLNQILAD